MVLGYTEADRRYETEIINSKDATLFFFFQLWEISDANDRQFDLACRPFPCHHIPHTGLGQGLRQG